MKIFAIIVCIALIGFVNSSLIAGQVYTWTDDKGNLHMTDTPPPAQSSVKDIIEYQEKTTAEIQAVKRQQESEKEKKRRESIRQQADRSAAQAARADQAAREAGQIAAEKYENAMRTYEIYGKTKNKRKKFKKRIRRAFDEAEAAQARAAEAAEHARQTQKQATDAGREVEALEEPNP